ncbi:MAG: helix-turn-helix domain-containing protein [Pseudonocardiaceae bacterium]
MIGIVDLQRAEADLVAGELSGPVPGCGGMLRPWGHGHSRQIRDHALTMLTRRPRRARCVACGATQVLLLGSVLPRRADTTAVIGTALLASAGGAGYQRIAADLGRPPSTVRRWLRSVRGGHTEWLYAQGVAWTHRVDREVFATITPAQTGLGDALTALAAAAGAIRARLTPHVAARTLIGRLTHGRLVSARAG